MLPAELSLFFCTYNVVHHLRAGLARPWLVTNSRSLANLDEVYARSTGTLARAVTERSRQVHALVRRPALQSCDLTYPASQQTGGQAIHRRIPPTTEEDESHSLLEWQRRQRCEAKTGCQQANRPLDRAKTESSEPDIEKPDIHRDWDEICESNNDVFLGGVNSYRGYRVDLPGN